MRTKIGGLLLLLAVCAGCTYSVPGSRPLADNERTLDIYRARLREMKRPGAKASYGLHLADDNILIVHGNSPEFPNEDVWGDEKEIERNLKRYENLVQMEMDWCQANPPNVTKVMCEGFQPERQAKR